VCSLCAFAVGDFFFLGGVVGGVGSVGCLVGVWLLRGLWGFILAILGGLVFVLYLAFPSISLILRYSSLSRAAILWCLRACAHSCSLSSWLLCWWSGCVKRSIQFILAL